MRDVHCHILPGVDDGSRNMAESLEMVQAAMRAGVTSIVCTPHCRDPWFDYDAMWDAFDELQKAVIKANISMAPRLSMGFEVNYKKLMELGFDWIDYLACRSGDFLLELPTRVLPSDWERMVFEIQGRGYRVIIAHPECYAPVQESLDVARRFVDAGCKIQVSADFYSESKFSAVKKTAKALFAENLVSYIASDAHKSSAYEYLRQARKEFFAMGAHANLQQRGTA